MPRVFIVQEQRELNQSKGRLQPKMDYRDAERFGQLVVLAPSTVNHYNVQEALDVLRSGLEDFNPETDWIIPTGAPILIGLATALAADKCDEGWASLRFLSWHGTRQCYIPVTAENIFGEK